MKFFKLLFISTLLCNIAFAQNNEDSSYTHGIHIESTGNSGTGANIDVVYHRAKWFIDPNDATKTLEGTVTTYFKTIVSNVSSISFDLNSASFDNSDLIITHHGSNALFNFTATSNVNVLSITLINAIVNAGTLDSVTISYKGIPPAATGSAEGYQRKQDANGNNYIYTLSESYEDKDWWPCKADMQDKIDSMDINIITPKAFWAATNGVMIDSTDDGTYRNFQFKHRYPIASYLVAVGVAKYKRLYLGNVNSNGKQVPYVVNIFSGKTTTEESNIMLRLNNNKLVMDALSKLWGEYPFAKEKHGYYEFGFSGGMEHQTMSGMGTNSLTSNSVLAHELGHQWWGDKVTFGTWNHLWLAEGFASYSEALAFEFVPSIGINHITRMATNKNTGRSVNSTSVLLNNITNSNTIWTGTNTNAIYQRGCMVASMLRVLLGDTKFFAACKNYLNDTALAYKSAVTKDLQRNMEQQFGENMTGFFTEWITKKGTPDYTVQWGNSGKNINIKLAQTISSGAGSVTASTFFPMPVELKIADASGTVDTTIVIYHKSANITAYAGNGIGATVNSNTISFPLSFVPATVTFDANNRTMANGTVTFNAALPIKKIGLRNKKNNNQQQLLVDISADEKIEKVTVEKSIDGNNFKTFFNASLFNNNVTNQQYQAIDENAIERNIYYRAKVTTAIETNYSPILKINNSAKKDFFISPNPAKDVVNISFVNANNTNYTFKIIDNKGTILQQLNTANNFLNINVNQYSKGLYFVEGFCENEKLGVKKLVVE